MGNSVYIVSVDAKDLFLANYSSPNSKEYSVKLAGSDHNDQFNTRRFVNTLDYSLDLIKLREVYEKVYRRMDFTFSKRGKEYCRRVINVTFKYIQTPEEVVRRFGVGFDAGDYDSMQYEYQDWVKRYGEPMDKRQEELYVSICFMKLNLRKLLQKGDSNIGTAANSYKSQIDAATTEIEDRKKKAEAEKQLSPLGEMIRDIEEFCPAEYYKDKKLYADFDHLKEYIERFMTRPLRNLLTGSKELDKEFSLSDSEE